MCNLILLLLNKDFIKKIDMVDRNYTGYAIGKFLGRVIILITGYILGKKWRKKPINKGFPERK